VSGVQRIQNEALLLDSQFLKEWHVNSPSFSDRFTLEDACVFFEVVIYLRFIRKINASPSSMVICKQYEES
jgi:hypothetical protein